MNPEWRRIEVVDQNMAEILRRKTPAQRIAIGFGLWRSARRMLRSQTIAPILLRSAVFAFALSARLHKWVSEPILSLARTASEVSENKDYSLQAPTQTEDELGTLVDSFRLIS